MALITRVARLFRADMHAVLDRIEEPDILLRQAVREMEDSLAHEEHRLKLLEHEHLQLAARQAELDQGLSEIETELDICFAAQKHDLARALVKRKLESQRLRKLVVQRDDRLEQTITTLREQLADNRARLESMRQKAELLTEDIADGQVQVGCDMPSVCVRDEDIEIAFLREQQKRAHP